VLGLREKPLFWLKWLCHPVGSWKIVPAFKLALEEKTSGKSNHVLCQKIPKDEAKRYKRPIMPRSVRFGIFNASAYMPAARSSGRIARISGENRPHKRTESSA
jgi:hypothetical protein